MSAATCGNSSAHRYLMAFGAMVALARRAREGGSWLVRVSLAGTGPWIVERGMLDRLR